jgi:excisionase family DNA binding protein
MTAKEVASFLKISVKTVYSYARRNMIPLYWKFQSNVRFEKRQIIDWMKEHNQAVRPKSKGQAA